MNFFSIVSALIKYVFIVIIYLFIFGIMRMIFLDIRRTLAPKKPPEISNDMPYLRLITSSSKIYYNIEEYYKLDKIDICIGRGKSCDIILDDNYLSTKNTRIWYVDNEWYIEDLGSTNGTMVNDVALTTPMILDNGDVITVGQVKFEVNI